MRMTLRVDELHPHEEVDPSTLERLIETIRGNESFEMIPLLVEQERYVILDGHHRHAACKALGIDRVPCVLVDYETEVDLDSRRPGLFVSKSDVIRRALTGDLYPPKSTIHVLMHADQAAV